jgi:hypothetical protein
MERTVTGDVAVDFIEQRDTIGRSLGLLPIIGVGKDQVGNGVE